MDLFVYFFEINLIKELGFDTNLRVFDQLINKDELYKKIELDNFKYEVPIFLIKGEVPKNTKEGTIKVFAFTRSILMNKFFLPNNLIFPKTRIIFENYFN